MICEVMNKTHVTTFKRQCKVQENSHFNLLKTGKRIKILRTCF